jgi:hypothetical protein
MGPFSGAGCQRHPHPQAGAVRGGKRGGCRAQAQLATRPPATTRAAWHARGRPSPHSPAAPSPGAPRLLAPPTQPPPPPRLQQDEGVEEQAVDAPELELGLAAQPRLPEQRHALEQRVRLAPRAAAAGAQRVPVARRHGARRERAAAGGRHRRRARGAVVRGAVGRGAGPAAVVEHIAVRRRRRRVEPEAAAARRGRQPLDAVARRRRAADGAARQQLALGGGPVAAPLQRGQRIHEEAQPEQLVAALHQDVLPHARRDERGAAAVGLRGRGRRQGGGNGRSRAAPGFWQKQHRWGGAAGYSRAEAQ